VFPITLRDIRAHDADVLALSRARTNRSLVGSYNRKI
jgi:hypothetical protein